MTLQITTGHPARGVVATPPMMTIDIGYSATTISGLDNVTRRDLNADGLTALWAQAALVDQLKESAGALWPAVTIGVKGEPRAVVATTQALLELGVDVTVLPDDLDGEEQEHVSHRQQPDDMHSSSPAEDLAADCPSDLPPLDDDNLLTPTATSAALLTADLKDTKNQRREKSRDTVLPASKSLEYLTSSTTENNHEPSPSVAATTTDVDVQPAAAGMFSRRTSSTSSPEPKLDNNRDEYGDLETRVLESLPDDGATEPDEQNVLHQRETDSGRRRASRRQRRHIPSDLSSTLTPPPRRRRSHAKKPPRPPVTWFGINRIIVIFAVLACALAMTVVSVIVLPKMGNSAGRSSDTSAKPSSSAAAPASSLDTPPPVPGTTPGTDTGAPPALGEEPADTPPAGTEESLALGTTRIDDGQLLMEVPKSLHITDNHDGSYVLRAQSSPLKIIVAADPVHPLDTDPQYHFTQALLADATIELGSETALIVNPSVGAVNYTEHPGDGTTVNWVSWVDKGIRLSVGCHAKNRPTAAETRLCRVVAGSLQAATDPPPPRG